MPGGDQSTETAAGEPSIRAWRIRGGLDARQCPIRPILSSCLFACKAFHTRPIPPKCPDYATGDGDRERGASTRCWGPRCSSLLDAGGSSPPRELLFRQLVPLAILGVRRFLGKLVIVRSSEVTRRSPKSGDGQGVMVPMVPGWFPMVPGNRDHTWFPWFPYSL